MPDIFKSVSVDIPNKSGFDMSHENFFSSKCGTLTPALIDTLLPGDKIDLSAIANVQLPPFASDFFGRIEFKMEAFFVPFRLLYGGWKEFITIPVDFRGSNLPESTVATSKQVSNVVLPKISVTESSSTDPSTGAIKFSDWLGAGSLADFLGYKVDPSTIQANTTPTLEINIMPFLAYHKVWDDWYRDSRLVSSCFAKYNQGYAGALANSVSFLPFVTFYSSSNTSNSVVSNLWFYNANYVSNGNNPANRPFLLSLRQRSFAKDYFTNATPQPQAGNQQSVGFTVNTSTGNGSFSIQSLRAANSIQTWLERNNLAGNRYPDQIKANFGVYPADGITDRCIYLGRVNTPVYAKSVYQTAPSNSGSNVATITQNPLESQGATFGAPQGVRSGTFCNNYTVTEHGYLFVMASLVPTAFYSTGIDRYFYDTKVTDFGWPLLQGTGDQQIYKTELINDPWNLTGGLVYPFGYSQKYSHFKFKNDQIHGLLRDGQNLQSFALQRSFSNTVAGTAPSVGYLFNEIPTNFLDQISAVSSTQSDYGYWADVYFKYYKVSTLSAYSIPTLGDLKNVHKESIPLGGKRL